MKKIFVLIGVLALFAISACQTGPTSPQEKCIQQGGEWDQFPNTCTDSCQYRRNPQDTVCGQALTMGCECGEDQCWNGNSCEKI